MIVFIHYWFALVWNLGLWLSSQCNAGLDFTRTVPVWHIVPIARLGWKKCNAKWKVLWEQCFENFLASFWIGWCISWPERFFGVVVQLYHAYTPTHKKILAFQMKKAKKTMPKLLEDCQAKDSERAPWAPLRSTLRPKIQLFTRNAHPKIWKQKWADLEQKYF